MAAPLLSPQGDVISIDGSRPAISGGSGAGHDPTRDLLLPLTLVARTTLAQTLGGCIAAEAEPGEDTGQIESAIDTGKVHEIVSIRSGLALDVTDHGKTDGAGIHQWGCSGGAKQRWKLVPVGGGGKNGFTHPEPW